MEENKRKHTSKFLSYVLRHRPEKIGLKLDKNGWANVDDLLSKSRSEFEINIEELKQIVEKCDKQRFKFNEDCTKIKANQGHSIRIDLDLKPIVPPNILYHGTANRYLGSIMKEGLKKMNRHHVHLYAENNAKKAFETGQRHEKGKNAVLLIIDAKEMHKDGCLFYKTDNDVYLTEFVNKKYIKIKN